MLLSLILSFCDSIYNAYIIVPWNPVRQKSASHSGHKPLVESPLIVFTEDGPKSVFDFFCFTLMATYHIQTKLWCQLFSAQKYVIAVDECKFPYTNCANRCSLPARSLSKYYVSSQAGSSSIMEDHVIICIWE